MIPSIVYALGLAEVLKLFKWKVYWELYAWGIVLIMVLILTWIPLYDRLPLLGSDNHVFVMILLQALIYYQLAGILTPDKYDIDTKKYFYRIRKGLFIVWTVLISIAIFNQYFILDDKYYLRFLLLPLTLACAWLPLWYRTIVIILTTAIGLVVIFSTPLG